MVLVKLKTLYQSVKGPQLSRIVPYTNAQRSSEGHGAIGFRMLHAGTGKKPADIVLALDPVELVLSKDMLCQQFNDRLCGNIQRHHLDRDQPEPLLHLVRRIRDPNADKVLRRFQRPLPFAVVRGLRNWI